MTTFDENINSNLPNIYGYGQIFAFSAIDGKTSFREDFVGTLTQKPVGIRFELKKPVTLYFDVQIKKCFAVTSDVIDIETERGRLNIVYSSCHTVIGISPVIPTLLAEYVTEKTSNGIFCKCDRAKIFLRYVKTEYGYAFILAYDKTEEAVDCELLSVSKSLVDELIAKRLEFYRKQSTINGAYGKLYKKCLSVLKANVYSGEGNIPCRFTTPDRVPHKKMWLWDSAFHALALKEFDVSLAAEAVEAVLYCQKKNGMIPHMMSPYKKSRITQPPVLAYAVWKIYQKSRDKDLLERTAEKLARYLLWDSKNRDKKKKGLLEWKTEHSQNCRCGESGMDNSPRFDNRGTMYAVDFSCFFANDCLCLSKIFAELQDQPNASAWQTRADEIIKKINACLWNEQQGMYYDLYRRGGHSQIDTCASFLPLFCGIATEDQAEKLVTNLTDSTKFAALLPIPSLSINNSDFSSDMWRGGVWINYNYMIIHGLKRYGYNTIAEEIKAKTINAVNKWYNAGGCVYEFYDAYDKERPDMLTRKGIKQQEPDWRTHLHAICDFGWTAALTMLLISDK